MISVQLSIADYVAGQRLHSTWSKRTWAIALGLTLPTLCVGLAAWLGAFSREFQTIGAFMVLWVAGTWVGSLGARAFLLPKKWSRSYASHKLIQSIITYSWDADHFMAKSEYGNSSIPWSKFLKFKEDQQSFLLYVSRMQFYCIPKHAFPTEAMRTEFAALLSGKVGP